MIVMQRRLVLLLGLKVMQRRMVLVLGLMVLQLQRRKRKSLM
jgi:hypothetical protein